MCLFWKRDEEFDVVVAGGGPAGINAAIASGRTGAKTLLIERYGFLGGMSTSTGLSLDDLPLTAGNQVIKGIAQEIVDRLMDSRGFTGSIARYRRVYHTLTNSHHPEKYKLLGYRRSARREEGVFKSLFIAFLNIRWRWWGIRLHRSTSTTKSG